MDQLIDFQDLIWIRRGDGILLIRLKERSLKRQRRRYLNLRQGFHFFLKILLNDQKRCKTIQKRCKTIQKRCKTIQKLCKTIQKRCKTIQKRCKTIQKRCKTIQKTMQNDTKTMQNDTKTMQKQTCANDHVRIGFKYE